MLNRTVGYNKRIKYLNEEEFDIEKGERVLGRGHYFRLTETC